MMNQGQKVQLITVFDACILIDFEVKVKLIMYKFYFQAH